MKIFWAWQSDTPGKIGRHLIKDALNQAINKLKEDSDIFEPQERENLAQLQLDHDRKDVPGSPDLAQTILKKIGESTVIVADVTLIDRIAVSAERTKGLINSNVAIELGYALHALTDQNLIMVFNTHYGSHEELPFDIRHKAGAIFFKLNENADRQQINAVKNQLVSDFTVALRPYLSKVSTKKDTNSFRETPSTSNKAVYFELQEILAKIGIPDHDEILYNYPPAQFCYLRLIPSASLSQPLQLRVLNAAITQLSVLNRKLPKPPIFGSNKYGAIAYVPLHGSIPGGVMSLKASTQLFKNGEIWSIDTSLIIRERAHRPAYIPIPLLVASAFVKGYRELLSAFILCARDNLGISPPWNIELGLCGTQDISLAISDTEYYGPIHVNDIIKRVVITTEDDINLVLKEFVSLVFDEAGYSVPEEVRALLN